VTTMLELRGISYSYPGANNGLLSTASAAIVRGERVGITGANGSGKSTLLKIFATLLKPTAGELLFGGRPIASCLREARSVLNYCAGAPQGFYPRLNAVDNLRFFSGMKGHMASRAELERLLARVGLGCERAALEKKYFQFSLGMRQRLHLARMMLEPAELLIADEPTNGLDARGVAILEDLLSKEAAGKTQIIVSHDRGFLERVTTRILHIENGALQ
jgi:ABC-type multidrug transport system ATPase subunit